MGYDPNKPGSKVRVAAHEMDRLLTRGNGVGVGSSYELLQTIAATRRFWP
jgi:hypothetical protein